jgi:hypothetical protein
MTHPGVITKAPLIILLIFSGKQGIFNSDIFCPIILQAKYCRTTSSKYYMERGQNKEKIYTLLEQQCRAEKSGLHC